MAVRRYCKIIVAIVSDPGSSYLGVGQALIRESQCGDLMNTVMVNIPPNPQTYLFMMSENCQPNSANQI